jgi:hypothetical protein
VTELLAPFLFDAEPILYRPVCVCQLGLLKSLTTFICYKINVGCQAHEKERHKHGSNRGCRSW